MMVEGKICKARSQIYPKKKVLHREPPLSFWYQGEGRTFDVIVSQQMSLKALFVMCDDWAWL